MLFKQIILFFYKEVRIEIRWAYTMAGLVIFFVKHHFHYLFKHLPRQWARPTYLAYPDLDRYVVFSAVYHYKKFFSRKSKPLAVLIYFGQPSGNYFCQNFLQCIVITYAYVLGLFRF